MSLTQTQMFAQKDSSAELKNVAASTASLAKISKPTTTTASKVAELTPALQEAKDSLLRLEHWKFQIDPTDEGVKLNWALPSFDDHPWATIRANKPWQAQGFPNHHGVAWYRTKIQVPAKWRGSKILFHSDGVKDEYDLFINGKLIRHFGSKQIPTDGVQPKQC